MVYQSEYEKYRGLRALILTRVSTAKQAKRFSHTAQERGVREDIIEPIMLYVVDVIRDTYTGLEYQYRESLDRILHMAEQREFDVLCMDVLDRGLGRKAVARELYRMQLRDFGIHILTTEPSEFHKQCQEWREKLDTPEFIPDFHFYREAVIFFGIHVKIWREGVEPRREIYTRSSTIVELLS